MTHCDAVIDGYGVEFSSIAAKSFYLFLYDLSGLVQMGMSGHELSKRIDNGNDGLSKLLTFHTVGHPERTCSSHSPTFSTYCTSQLMLHFLFVFYYE